MGASGWHERQAWAGSLEATLAAAQDRVLASGDFIWPWDEIDPDDVDEMVARPGTREELATAKQVEEFWDEGTHTILDVERVVTDPAEDDFAAIRPLTPAEATAVAGSATPEPGALASLLGAHGPIEALLALDGQKWSGRALVFGGAAPVEVLFWGWSGD